jgi:hypothetical protein
MYWHAGIQVAALALFAWPTWKRWRQRVATPAVAGRLVACLGAVLLMVGSAIGGYIVYHGGAGVDPDLLAPEVRESHSHSDETSEEHNHSHSDHASDEHVHAHGDGA